MKTTEAKIKRSVRISPDVIEKIQKIADEKEWTFSYTVDKILREYKQ